MKKLTLKVLSLLLALVMSLSFAFVGCTDDNLDDDDDGDKKSSTVKLTKENAEEVMLSAYEKLSNTKYFEGTSVLYHSQDGEADEMTVSMSVQKDGENYTVISETKGKIDDNASAENDNCIERTYVSGKTVFTTEPSDDGSGELIVYDKPMDTQFVVNLLTDELFMLPFATTVKNFCAKDFKVSKEDNVYTLSLELKTYEDAIKLFVSDEYDADDYGEYDSFSGEVNILVNKKGEFIGFSVDMEFSAQGMTFVSKISASIDNINEEKTVSEPEWYTNRSYASGDTLSEVRDGVKFEYTMDRSGTLAFNGAYYYDDYDIDTVKYYKLLTELDGMKVTEIDYHGHIDIENLIVPGAGVGFRNGFSDSNCTIFLDGETNITFSPDYFAVKGIYAAGDWEMVDGLPVVKDGAKPLYPSSGNDFEEVLPDDGGSETPDYPDDGGNDNPDIGGGDTPDDGDDTPTVDAESAKFVGKWATDFDFTEFFNEIMDASLGEMTGYFNFDDITISYIVEFFADGTYQTQADKDSIDELMLGIKNAMKAGLTSYINDMASQSGYPSGDALCQAEFGMSLEEYVNESAEGMDLSNSFPIDDTKTSGRYKAEDGKLYLAEGPNDFSSTNYTPYEFINDYTFQMSIPENADMGDIDEETEDLYEMIIGMFPLVFNKMG